jgi:hypothetical protein
MEDYLRDWMRLGEKEGFTKSPLQTAWDENTIEASEHGLSEQIPKV